MAREAHAFSRELAALRTALAEHAAATAALLGIGGSVGGGGTKTAAGGGASWSAAVAAMLAAPLPRVWDSVEGRLAEPLRATDTHYGPGATAAAAASSAPTLPPAGAYDGPAAAGRDEGGAFLSPRPQQQQLSHTVGGGGPVPAFSALEAAASELLTKVDGSVLAPLDAWQRDLALATARLPELEGLRAELGSALGRAAEARARAEAAASAADAGEAREGEQAAAGTEATLPSRRRRGADDEGADAGPTTTPGEAMAAEPQGEGVLVLRVAERGGAESTAPPPPPARPYLRQRLVPPATGGALGPVGGHGAAAGAGEHSQRQGGLGRLLFGCGGRPRTADEEEEGLGARRDPQYGGGLLGRRRRVRARRFGRGGHDESRGSAPGSALGPSAGAGAAGTPGAEASALEAHHGAAGRQARAAVREEDLAVDAALAQRAADAARASFEEAEASAARQLSALSKDASWTKSYCLAELRASKDAAQAAAVGLGPVLLPLPGLFEHHPAAPARGAWAGVAPVAFAPPLMPALAPPGGGGGAIAAAAGRRVGPAGRLRQAEREAAAGPHVATAAPMLLGAREDVSGMQRAPVPAAGRAVPSDSLVATATGAAGGGGGMAPVTPARPGLVAGGVGEEEDFPPPPVAHAGFSSAGKMEAAAPWALDAQRREFVQQQ